MRFVEHDAVVVGELLARPDLARRLDEHTVLAAVAAVVLVQHGLAVGLAAVVDPARVVAADVGVDDPVVVEREQERMPAVGIAPVALVDLVMRPQRAAVLDDAQALGQVACGENAVAVDRRSTGDDVAGHVGLL